MPRLRGLRCGPGDLPGPVERGAASPRDRLRLGHRVLEPHPGLHDGLRLQQRPRPGAADRAGDQAREPRPPRPRGRGRRRRLLDRRRARGPRRPAQHGPHLHRDGQPDLRAHQGPALAHLAAGPADRVLDLGQPGGAGEPAALRARLRRELRRPGHARGHAGPRLGHRGGRALPGLRLRQRAVALRDLRPGGPAAEGPQGDDADARQPRPRPGRPAEGDGARVRVRRTSSTPASSTATRSRRPPTRRRPGAGRRRRGPRPARRSASSRCSGRSSRGAPP